MPLVNGEKVRADLMAAAKRRQHFLDQAREIEETVFKPLNLDPDALFKKDKRHIPSVGYTDMASSKLASIVLEHCSKHGGKVGTTDVIRLLQHNRVKCSPYVLLTRMVKANLLHRLSRGVYHAPNKTA